MELRFRLLCTVLASVLGVAAVPASGVHAAPTCFGRAATIIGGGAINGTPGDDVIVGSPGPDTIHSGLGVHFICSGDGDDDVSGDGEVWISGGAGNDLLQGGSYSSAHLFGGSGNDILNGGASIGVDVFQELSGGDGADRLENGDVQDATMTAVMDGGGGNDTFPFSSEIGSIVDLTIVGGSGDDHILLPFLHSSTLNLVISGGSGSDLIEMARQAGPASDSSVSNITDGRSGDDTISGMSSDGSSTVVNNIDGGPGADALFGGNGVAVTNNLNGGGRSKWGGDVCTPGVDSVDTFVNCPNQRP